MKSPDSGSGGEGSSGNEPDTVSFRFSSLLSLNFQTLIILRGCDLLTDVGIVTWFQKVGQHWPETKGVVCFLVS
jgi:hypothetical protein